MLQRLKALARDALPRRWQVPVKYWYGRVRGDIEPEMALLRALVDCGDHVVDVGGNRGTYAYRLWRIGARIEVFEPNPDCIGVLRGWAAGLDRVTVHGVALSSQAGTAQLHVPVDEHGVAHDASASLEAGTPSDGRDIDVPLRTLDSFGFTDVSLIKIDVEGHESNVIEGAAVTLRAARPALLIEIEQRHRREPIYTIFRDIEAFGYRGFFLLDGRLVGIERFDVVRHQSLQAFESNSSRYHNNFLFLDAERLKGGGYATLKVWWDG